MENNIIRARKEIRKKERNRERDLKADIAAEKLIRKIRRSSLGEELVLSYKDKSRVFKEKRKNGGRERTG